MRHAKQSGLTVRDHDRPLTKEGREAAHRVGLHLREIGVVPDAVLSSTALRCRQTFECLEAGVGRSIPADFEPNLYNASARDLLEGLAGVTEDSIGTLLLLAHNPGMSMLAIDLSAGDEEALERTRGGFTPATTAQFEIRGAWSEISPQTARLLRFDPTP